MSTAMTPEIYTQKRNELIDLLETVVGRVKDLPLIPDRRDKHLEDLCRTGRRLREDQFKVVLISEFQGGKSTTFNALCDGMEISPCGSNIKTSATVISAQNTTDPSEAWTAVIHGRTDLDLMLIFAELIENYMRHTWPEDYKECFGTDEFASKIDFSKDLPRLKQALAAEWDEWEQDKGIYDTDHLDMLRIGSLICEYYNHPGIARMRTMIQKGHVFKIDEVGPLVRFPNKWQVRWKDGNARAFAPEECYFAFIREVACKVSSKNLERTGSVIIDCPGLFASRYDTKVAKGIISESDAVWFLCGGKALGASQIEMIKEIKKNRCDTPFFTINMKDGTFNNFKSAILPEDHATICNSGFNIPVEQMKLYHALLALRAEQAKHLLKRSLPESTQKIICEMYKKLNDEEPESTEYALSETIEEQLRNLKVPERKEYDKLNEQGIAIARRVSGMDEIVSAIESKMITDKAASILLANGSKKIEATLKEFEGELKNITDDAELSEQQAHEEYDKAAKVLDEFHKDVEKEIKRMHLDESDGFIDKKLAEDYFDHVILDSIDSIAPKAAEKIKNAPKKYFIFTDTESIQNILYDIVSDEMTSYKNKWLQALKDGKNQMFNHLYNFQEFNNRIEEKWNLRVSDATRLNGVPQVLFVNIEAKSELTNFDISHCLPRNALLWWFTHFKLTRERAIDSVTKDLIERLKKNLTDFYKNNMDSMIEKIQKILSEIRTDFRKQINAMFEKQNLIFEQMKQNALNEFKHAQSDRIAKGRMAAEVREERIIPLRKQIESFQSEVQKLLATVV